MHALRIQSALHRGGKHRAAIRAHDRGDIAQMLKTEEATWELRPKQQAGVSQR